jgi:hypothetical protein
MIFYDTETCGLHGPIVLIQYAFDNGPVNLHSVWRLPISETLELIEEMMYHPGGVVGFNLSFDHFHLCQLYTTLSLLDRTWIPQEHIIEYALKEPEARDGLCLKPQKALDLMLHARKGPYQSTMNRNDIKIRRVPTILAYELVKVLNERIVLNDIYFARRQDKTIRWQVFDIEDDVGNFIPEFKNVVLKFSPSSALKNLAIDTGVARDHRLFWKDVELSEKIRPVEHGYAPYALAVGNVDNWKGAWPDVINHYIRHWSYNTLAREYAEDDVLDTRGLYYYFKEPEMDDDDSVLACMVGAVRWKGFKISLEKLLALKKTANKTVKRIRAKYNFNAPAVVRKYLEEVLSEEEKSILIVNDKITTKAVVLEELKQWKISEICEKCNGFGCDFCDDGLITTDTPHPAALRADEILSARKAKKEIELYDKLLLAKRFHADFVVLGTLSSRMAGGGELNPQGIKKAKDVRSCFDLADSNYILCGGDFAGFEVCLADAAYGDPVLRKELKSGKKIHGLFGTVLFPPKTYEEIIATDGAFNFYDDLYGRSKNGVFALLYGGTAYTLSTRVGISEEVGSRAEKLWIKKYKVWGMERKRIFDMFCSMRQPGGIGTKVEWKDPSEYIESLLGFRRYFTLENKIVKALFDLAESPPKTWTNLKINTVRRDRVQTVSGAVRSSLFAAAFALQAANMRAAANHVIQSTGAQITKGVQRVVWDVQPAGINHWRVQPLNIHDEIMTPTHPDFVNQVEQVVYEKVESYRNIVPLIEMDWSNNLKNWAEK